MGVRKSKKVIRFLLTRLHVCYIQKSDLESTLTGEFADYDDAIQHEIAKLHGEVDYIITRNWKDFRNSQIDVLSPEELNALSH